MSIMSVKNYLSLMKLNVVWLLVFTGLGGVMAASDGLPGIYEAGMALLTITLGSAGAESLSNYLERDIDSVMKRTRRRPLPRGLIKPEWKAMVFGVVLITLSLTIAAFINPVTFLFMAFGIFDYVVIYVMLSKRRTPFNIILGSFAGGAPVMAGYAAIANGVTAEAWMLAALVVIWIPSHVWSLALRYRDDYARANIPMLPVVIDERKAIRCIASTAVLLIAFSVILYFLNPARYGLIYLTAAASLGAVLMALSTDLILRPDQEKAWRLFKFTSPHLALIFLAIIIEALV